MGRAINKTVMVVELIKRRIVGLHQNTTTGSTDITDMWEPLEEGLLPLETTRHVSMITITLSKKELDTSSIGYAYCTLLSAAFNDFLCQCELELLSDGANVYKLIGPVLVKHDLAETKANVKKHIEYISAELKRMDRALKDLEEKQNNKKESMFTLFRIIVGSTISVIISFMWKLNVAADIQTMLEETQLKFEEERQNLLKVLSNTSKEQCEGSLNEEYNKFQETYDMFCKEKDAHMQTFRGGSVDCPRLPAYKSPAAKPAVTRTPSRSANPPPRLKLRVAHPPQSCHPEQGNPHFVRDVRVLVKPYKEKGKVPGRFRKLQHAHHGGAEFAGCASPTGLLDSRDPYALLLLSGAQVFSWA
uniref:DNA/RNA-binding protein Alba-like domain-containing protein n=1 Tax=Zea mays TaxID=4577 RepID=A0A804PCG2_MAIZE